MSVVLLSSDTIEVSCYPQHGFVIGAIRERADGRNVLWNTPNARFAPLNGELGPTGSASIKTFDQGILAGGWFLMFPTAGLPGDQPVWMHGEAARVPWTVVSTTTDSVVCEVSTPVSGFDLRRSVRVNGPEVRVETVAVNRSGETREVTFGEHPCFPRTEFAGGMAMVVPDTAVVSSTADPTNATLVSDAPFDWPVAPRTNSASTDLSRIPRYADGRHDHVELTVPLGAVTLTDAERGRIVELTWDSESMPHALIWQHFRPVGSPWDGDVFAVEPGSAPGRTLTEAISAAGTTRVGDGESLATWASLRVTRDRSRQQE